MVAFEMTCRSPWFTRISIRSLVRERAFVQGKNWHDVTGTFQTSGPSGLNILMNTAGSYYGGFSTSL